MQSYYRDEMRRAMAWKGRLDRTTNWAVVLTGTLLTWAFSDLDNPHYVIIICMLIICFFLSIEARRYRFYDVWRSRLRLIEEDVLANALFPEGAVHENWTRLLAEDLRNPTLKMSWLEAVQRRLRRVYLVLLLLLLLSWSLRVIVFDSATFPTSAKLSFIPGIFVFVVVCVIYSGLVLLACWPLQRQAKGQLQDGQEIAEDWQD